ncbi:hypothetical protein WICPIJ_008443 [Wickerhamomyces pijperi]|uniref:Secreted protein n=1 Tax=Wickerhamomyces pijperi TaxID=599730 RepID=A0A9P8TIM6_WICPI|nr:hypothetical protein WICPIJ_008443 [Wickerhamomyces pijperi]
MDPSTLLMLNLFLLLLNEQSTTVDRVESTASGVDGFVTRTLRDLCKGIELGRQKPGLIGNTLGVDQSNGICGHPLVVETELRVAEPFGRVHQFLLGVTENVMLQ